MIKNKTNKLAVLMLLLAVSASLLLFGCGSSEEDTAGADDTGTAAEEQTAPVSDEEDDFSYETDPYAEMSDAELEALKQEAALKNKDEKNFYGTWRADTEEAYNLYGNLTLKINKDGTFSADLSDGEEKINGTWKKVSSGIAYKSELMSGKLFFGEYCELTIDNSEWDYDDEETGMAVTLQKVK